MLEISLRLLKALQYNGEEFDCLLAFVHTYRILNNSVPAIYNQVGLRTSSSRLCNLQIELFFYTISKGVKNSHKWKKRQIKMPQLANVCHS